MMSGLSGQLQIAIILQLVLYLASTVKAECCGCPTFNNCGVQTGCRQNPFDPFKPPCCDDCSVCTPYCGVGGCNIFGCHCTGGCRPEGLDRMPWWPWFHHPTPETIAHDQFSSTDKDNNGAIDIKEALLYFIKNEMLTSLSEFTKGLKEADKNGDSFISPKEFDNSLEDYPEKNLTATFTL